MAGPLTAIVEVYQTGALPAAVSASVWVLVLSASSLVVGLATYGYRVTQVRN